MLTSIVHLAIVYGMDTVVSWWWEEPFSTFVENMGSLSYSIRVLVNVMTTQSIGLMCVLRCVRHVHLDPMGARKQYERTIIKIWEETTKKQASNQLIRSHRIIWSMSENKHLETHRPSNNLVMGRMVHFIIRWRPDTWQWRIAQREVALDNTVKAGECHRIILCRTTLCATCWMEPWDDMMKEKYHWHINLMM